MNEYYGALASPQTSVGVRLSRIHFSTDVCGEANGAQENANLFQQISDNDTMLEWRSQ